MPPTYTYACSNCGYSVDVMHPMNVKHKRILCVCCDRPLKKQIGPGAGVIFKGSGFYQTDYKNKEKSQ